MDQLIAIQEIDETVTTPTVRDSGRGTSRSVFFRVPTEDRAEALGADGLPRRGDTIDGLVVAERLARAHPYGQSLTLVEIVLVSESLAIQLDPQQTGGEPPESYTEIRASTRSVAVREAQNVMTQDVEPLPMGETLSEEVSEIELVAHAFVPGSTALGAVVEFLGIINRHNNNQVAFPPMRFQGSGSRVVAPPKTLLARSIEVRPVGEDFVELVLGFAHAPEASFEVTLVLFGADGTATSRR